MELGLDAPRSKGRRVEVFPVGGGVDCSLGAMKNSAKIVHGPVPAKKRRQSDRVLPKKLRARLATDRSSLPVLGSAAASAQPLIQSGVLAFRRLEGGDVAVLLVKKPNSKNWGIPKGNAEPHLTLAENAAKEAFEEAGVKEIGRAHV